VPAGAAERPTLAGQTEQATRRLRKAVNQVEAVVEGLDGIAASGGHTDEVQAGKVDPTHGGQDLLALTAFVVAAETAGATPGRIPFFSTPSASASRTVFMAVRRNSRPWTTQKSPGVPQDAAVRPGRCGLAEFAGERQGLLDEQAFGGVGDGDGQGRRHGFPSRRDNEKGLSLRRPSRKSNAKRTIPGLQESLATLP